MFVTALGVATLGDRAVTSLRRRAPGIKRWGGAVLVLVGLWLFALAVFAERFADLFPV